MQRKVIRKVMDTVAGDLDFMIGYVRYDRFNNCYNEQKEGQIEWLESLLHKLGTIEKGNSSPIGYLAQVGRLVKEYTEEHCQMQNQTTTYLYLEFMEYFVSDGILEEHHLVYCNHCQELKHYPSESHTVGETEWSCCVCLGHANQMGRCTQPPYTGTPSVYAEGVRA